MSDNLPTVWPADPHTLAKHKILDRYLKAWMAILSSRANLVQDSKRILYIDGFAGPGIYEGRQPGSPIIALRAALEHDRQFPVPVRFLFVEYDKDRYESLQQEVDKLRPRFSTSKNVEDAVIKHGDCTSVLTPIVDKPIGKGKFGPAMVFLDQFGWSQIPITLIEKILHWPQCEVFSYLNWDHLNHWMEDPAKTEGISKAFGSEVWKQAFGMDVVSRRGFILNEYKQALTRAGAKWVLDFAMFGDQDQLLYWLFFCTNNLRGLEEMKKAMWKVDESGGYKFADRDDPNQLLLLSTFSQQWLALELKRRLKGQTLTLTDLSEFVLVETPCYLWRDAVKMLEKENSAHPVNSPIGRKPLTYPPQFMHMSMRFD